MQHICDMFGVRQTNNRTTPKSTRWNIYRAALFYAWGPADVASDTRRVCTHQLCRSLQECSLFVFVREEKTKQTHRPTLLSFIFMGVYGLPATLV
jgi:hypothetical protein